MGVARLTLARQRSLKRTVCLAAIDVSAAHDRVAHPSVADAMARREVPPPVQAALMRELCAGVYVYPTQGGAETAAVKQAQGTTKIALWFKWGQGENGGRKKSADDWRSNVREPETPK